MQGFKSTPIWNYLDVLGAGLSFLCALHCALIPVLLILVPSLSLGIFASESLELGIIIGSLCIATVSLYRGFLKHRRNRVIASGVFCAVLMTGSWYMGYEQFAIMGGVGLALCHLLNYRLVKETCS